MHLMSYDKVVDELKLILKNKGVIIWLDNDLILYNGSYVEVKNIDLNKS